MENEILRRRLCLGFLCLVACAAVVRPARANLAEKPLECRLWAGIWELNTWGYDGRGVVCWVLGPVGIRLEVLETDLPSQEAMQALWGRRGRGWTLVLDDSGSGIAEAWGEPWHPLDKELGSLVARLVLALVDFTRYDQESAAEIEATGALERRRLVIPGQLCCHGVSKFHSRLVTRGRGQGGGGQILTLARAGEMEGGGLPLTLSSSRRPGRITMTLGLLGKSLGDLQPEFFSPLWPVGEFLEFPDEYPELFGQPCVEKNAVLYGRLAAGARP